MPRAIWALCLVLFIACESAEARRAREATQEILARSEERRITDSIHSAASHMWIINQDVDPIDDSKRVTAILFADGAKGPYGDEVGLVVRCDGKKLDVYASWHAYITDEVRVTSRIGSAPARTTNWRVSTDKEASFYPGNTNVLLGELKTADRWILQVTPYNESPITAVFHMDQISSVITAMPDCPPRDPPPPPAPPDRRVIGAGLYKIYYPRNTDCWRSRIFVDTVYFSNAEVAEKAGFTASTDCYDKPPIPKN